MKNRIVWQYVYSSTERTTCLHEVDAARTIERHCARARYRTVVGINRLIGSERYELNLAVNCLRRQHTARRVGISIGRLDINARRALDRRRGRGDQRIARRARRLKVAHA